ncbi:MAG: MCE family protein [Bacteroidaceae bacterium]|nr:MCE family protein [Bacteroidaceae bacterium]
MKKEVKIGITAIVAIILFYIGINFLKGVNVFTTTNTYYVKFENAGGLTPSASVLANGYAVGIVREINYNYSDNQSVVVSIELDKAMHVPEGTTAELETSLMGSVTLHLLPGKNPVKYLERGDTISGRQHFGAMERAAEMLPQVEQMLPKVDSIMGNLNRLTGDSAMLALVKNLAIISENLAQTTSRVDHLMGKEIPVLLSNMNALTGNLNKVAGDIAKGNLDSTMTVLHATMQNAETLTSRLNALTSTLNSSVTSMDNSLGLLLNDRSIYDGLNHTIHSADSLLIDIKANPKRYIHFSVFGKKN